MIKKNILQDIKPISRKPRVASPAEVASPEPVHEDLRVPRIVLPREVPFEPSEPQHSSRYALWYIAVACVIGFLFALSFLFEHASVTVTPKSVPVAFDATDTFTAQKDSKAPDVLVYTEMTLSGDESMKLPSTQTKTEAVPATGRVVLYNTYATSPYKLVKNTRLATTAGKIYRINTAVTIPGYTKSGTTVTPGSVEVDVTAAVAGEDSNIDTGDFTLPGLAGTPQASKIYGRTKTPIAGGLSGTIYSIGQDAANAALGTLQTKLKASLIAKAKVQVPDGYLFYDGATSFQTDDAVKAPYSKTSDVPLALHGTLAAYLIKEDTLSRAITQKFVSQYNGEAVTIPKIESLTLVPGAPLVPATDTTFSFTLSGSADIVWVIKPDEIQALLAGKKKADFQQILAGEAGVNKAQVVIKPFWKQSFPEDISRIAVTVGQPEQ